MISTSFPAMGSRGVVTTTHGDPALHRRARARIAALEAAWSRFVPTSEVSRLNAGAGGAPVAVGPDTLRLVTASVAAWRRTRGRFDPTLHGAILALGYATPRAADAWPAPAPLVLRRTPAPGCRGIRVDAAAGTVALPDGVALDPGGIGKGLAADLVAAELVESGAGGALVSLGGDLVCAGEAPAGGWPVHVEHPLDRDRAVATIVVERGAVCTTSAARRRFGVEPHLLDPADGLPARRPWLAATVVAGAGWWAEALAKVAYLDGDIAAVAPEASCLLVDETGSIAPRGAAPWQEVAA